MVIFGYNGNPIYAPIYKMNNLLSQANNNAVIAIAVKNISKQFLNAETKAQLTVLQTTNFTITAGSSVAIVGPSGSGKTTLLGLCAGLDSPTTGTITLCGNEISNMTEDERAAVRGKWVGFVFQNFQLLPTLTALENVMVPLELRGADTRQARKDALELLERVGLASRMHHFPTQLSGGEQQRVALARGFVTRPQVLFADEPTGNLDGENNARIADLLFELNAMHGTTLILSTHDLELASRTQRIMKLKNGVIVSDETAVAHATSV